MTVGCTRTEHHSASGPTRDGGRAVRYPPQVGQQIGSDALKLVRGELRVLGNVLRVRPSALRQVVESPSDMSTMCSLLALARRWLPRNSISSEIWADVRDAVPSVSIDVVRCAKPALSSGSETAPDLTTSPNATVGSPRFSTCKMFQTVV